MNSLKDLIRNADLNGIRSLLLREPSLANEPIPLDDNAAKAHPLHRLCDAVFDGSLREEDAVSIASLLLDFGAQVDGNVTERNKDTPLVAAASLHADELALLYLEHGANIAHPGCHGGTALHWAAWCGRPRLVQELIERGAPINIRCADFKSTPLLWAVHGFRSNGSNDVEEYTSCVHLLLGAGADKTIPNAEGRLPVEFVNESHPRLGELLRND